MGRGRDSRTAPRRMKSRKPFPRLKTPVRPVFRPLLTAEAPVVATAATPLVTPVCTDLMPLPIAPNGWATPSSFMRGMLVVWFGVQLRPSPGGEKKPTQFSPRHHTGRTNSQLYLAWAEVVGYQASAVVNQLWS